MVVVEELPDYSITEDGKLVNNITGFVRWPSKRATGYMHFSVKVAGKKTTRLCHRLVAIAYVPNPGELPQVNHIDGDKTNNHWTNLEWCSAKENIDHAHKLGLSPAGSKHYYSKLNEEKVAQIKNLLRMTFDMKHIAELYEVHYQTIYAIKTGRNWKGVN